MLATCSRALLCAGCSVVALVGSTAAMAQTVAGETTARSAPQIDEIVVTARKVEENLQDVPISITALTGEALQRQSAVKLNDIGQFTPNTRLRTSPADPTSMVLQIRGQVQQDILSTLDPSVGLYVDGIYWARAYGANANLLDIQRTEVLKGPQGTLFGRNTTGGAINIKTNDPDFNGISGLVSGTYGSHDQVEGTGVLNLPIAQDRIALRVAGTVNSFGGYGEDLVTGASLHDYDSWTGRAKLLVQATDDFSLLFSAEKYHYNGAGSTPALIYANPAAAGAINVNVASGGTDALGNYVYDGNGSPYDLQLGFRPYAKVDTETYAGTAVLDTDWGTVTAIVGYRSFESHRSEDLDGSPYTVLTAFQNTYGHQWSQELQFAGTTMDDRLSWTAGLFHFNETIPVDSEDSFALTSINPAAPARSDVTVRNESMAVFGQGTYSFSPAFSITAGLRYSVDDRQLIARNNSGPNRTCNIPLPLRADPAICRSNQKRSDNGVSYTLSANFEPTDTLLVYAKTAKSFRSGGFQLRGGSSVESFTPFEPESVTDYEVGVKTELFDRRVRFNAAAFYSDYKNIQRTLVVPRSDGGITTIINNAAKARVIGGEAELTAIPVEGLELNGSIGITRPKYKEFSDLTGDRSDEEFEFVPKFTAAAGAQYTYELPFGRASIRGDYSYTSKQVAAKNTTPPATVLPGYGLVNARASLAFDDPNVELAVFARNLFDKRYRFYVLDLVTSGIGLVDGFYGPPRQIGVQATWRFGS